MLLFLIDNTQYAMQPTVSLATGKLVATLQTLCTLQKSIEGIPKKNLPRTNTQSNKLNPHNEPPLLPKKDSTNKTLCFTREYFHGTVLKKHNDGYHGLPPFVIWDVLQNGLTMPNPRDFTWLNQQRWSSTGQGRSTIYFKAAAIKRPQKKCVYCMLLVIQDAFNNIFHMGIHSQTNANKNIGTKVVTACIEKLKSILNIPLLDQDSTRGKNKKEKRAVWQENEQMVQITPEQFDKIYPCSQATDYNTAETVVYRLPNGELLITPISAT
jgi:hypothetical protein